jgi:hypothetical protein
VLSVLRMYPLTVRVVRLFAAEKSSHHDLLGERHVVEDDVGRVQEYESIYHRMSQLTKPSHSSAHLCIFLIRPDQFLTENVMELGSCVSQENVLTRTMSAIAN